MAQAVTEEIVVLDSPENIARFYIQVGVPSGARSYRLVCNVGNAQRAPGGIIRSTGSDFMMLTSANIKRIAQ